VDFHEIAGLKPTNVPKIKLFPLAHLVRYERNARTHSPAQVAQLESLMLEFGWTNPVMVDESGIIAGHGRCMAAENIYKRGGQINWPGGQPIPIGYVPCLDCTGWSTEQRRAYIIADNASALASGWDNDLLALELKELEAAEFDLSLTALDDDFMAELLAGVVDPVADKDPDAAPPAPDTPASVPGDVWLCGAHRVMCGSSLVIDDWDRLMNGEQADCCWTDPPYNVDIGEKNKALDRADGFDRSKSGAIKNDKMLDGEFYQFLLDAYSAIFANLKPGAPIYVAHADKESHNFRVSFERAGFKFSSLVVWRKNTIVLGRSDYQSIHEPILYGWKPGSAHRWYGGRKNTSVIDLGEGGPFTRMDDGRYQIKIGDSVLVVSADAVVEEHPSSVLYEPKPQRSELHPTMKPVALVERMLKQSARAGDIVIDAFGGSGTTLIAADRLGMCARLMELDPKFCDVIVRRWEMYTGRRAVHAITGEIFPRDGELRAPPVGDGSIGGNDGDVF
jgi:DNA modification methylase